ncbi:MAG: DUF2523 domain-containing protein [Dehalococcoidia bacterium]|nr:MAG: DUF2523 domain-containing protein [Dehalococcoidia bacterium]
MQFIAPLLSFLGGLFTSSSAFFLKLFSSGYIKYILAAIGIGIVTYTGGTLLISSTIAYLVNNFTSLPPEVVPLLAIAKVDTFLNLILSGYTSGIALRAATNLSSRFMVIPPA